MSGNGYLPRSLVTKDQLRENGACLVGQMGREHFNLGCDDLSGSYLNRVKMSE
jgi:hypothetical protein